MDNNYTFKPFQTLMYGIGEPGARTPVPQSEREREFMSMSRTPVINVNNDRFNAMDERMNNIDNRMNAIGEQAEWLKIRLSNIMEELVSIKISINKLSQER